MGGATGVEFAGALIELVHFVLAKDYPELSIHAARVVLVHDRAVPVAPDPRGQGSRVAEVAVDAHLARVEVHEVDPALAHGVSSPKFASP